jgi:hypothetical protein
MEVNRYDKEDVDDQEPDRCGGGCPPCGIAAFGLRVATDIRRNDRRQQ